MATAPAPKMNDLIECPYNKAHQILRTRIQTHLIKCRRNNRDAKKVTCPFNTTHVINHQELNWHVENCEDRGSFDRYKHVIETQIPGKSKNINEPPPENHEEIECAEDWSDICVETYNPNKYCSSAPVLRQKIGGTPLERKAFRAAEKIRLRAMDN